MGQMQDRILNVLKERAEKVGLDFVVQPDWSNTGNVYLMKGLTSKLAFWYDFQVSYGKISIHNLNGEKMRYEVHLEYTKLEENMNRVFEYIDKAGA